MSEQKAHGCASEAFPGEFSGGGWAGEMEALGWGGFRQMAHTSADDVTGANLMGIHFFAQTTHDVKGTE